MVDESRRTERSGPTATAARFARELREVNLRADLASVIGFVRALTFIDIARESDVRAAGAALFVRRPEELPVYHAAFDRFWSGRRDEIPRPAPAHGAASDTRPSETGRGARLERQPEKADEDAGEPDSASPAERPAAVAYSPTEALRAKSFERMTPDELRDAARVIDHLRPRLQRRPTRRYRIHSHGSLTAPRAMLRRSLATGGELLAWLWRRRTTRSRPFLALCDISGSMELHARIALRFVHALTRVDARTESFVFGTQLTRITPALRRRDPDQALEAVAGSVRDWSGGTQIGKALHEFNRHWARRVLRSSGIVLIVSDGWDRGDPDLIANEMALLRRRCHRLVWLNPLAGTSGYEPRTAGMAAALPHIDDFLPAGNIETLERLAELLAASAPMLPGEGRRRATDYATGRPNSPATSRRIQVTGSGA